MAGKRDNNRERIEEKRSFPRFPANLKVELEIEGVVHKEGNYLIDVSLGGIALHTSREIKSADQILLRIPADKPFFEGYGEVAWVRKKENFCQAGVRFINMTGKSIDTLHQLLLKVRNGEMSS